MFDPHAQPRLHDWFSAELDAPLIGSSDEQLARLAARQLQLSGHSLNWVGTYRHGAESFLRFLEQEQQWAATSMNPEEAKVHLDELYCALNG